MTVHERLTKLDVDLILALDPVLQTHNVTEAAQRLGISQPALSARLVRLRSIFDDRLFVPASSGRGVVPTQGAASLRIGLTEVITGLERIVTVGAGFTPATSERTFTIALNDDPAAIIAPGLVPRVAADAPGVRLAFVMQNRIDIAARLENGDVDLIVTLPAEADPSWIGRTLLNGTYRTAHRKGHPRGSGPVDLDCFCALDHLLVSTDGGGFRGDVDEALSGLGRKRRVAASTQSYTLAPSILVTSDYVCTLPTRFFEMFANRLGLFEPPLDLGTFTLGAYWHARHQDDAGHVWLRQRMFDIGQAQPTT